MISFTQLMPALQTAIGPVILISGVGLILIMLTNRYARIIDKSRALSVELSKAKERVPDEHLQQIDILWQRARLCRMAIFFIALSALSAAVLVIALFLLTLLQIDAAWLLAALFMADMGFLITALVLFICDINRSLAALKLELDKNRRICDQSACKL
jgi:hypothetical protein